MKGRYNAAWYQNTEHKYVVETLATAAMNWHVSNCTQARVTVRYSDYTCQQDGAPRNDLLPIHV